jgi:hypothetical protein
MNDDGRETLQAYCLSLQEQFHISAQDYQALKESCEGMIPDVFTKKRLDALRAEQRALYREISEVTCSLAQMPLGGSRSDSGPLKLVPRVTA